MDLKDVTEKREFLGGLGTAAKTVLFLTLKNWYLTIAAIDICVSIYRLFYFFSTYDIRVQDPAPLFYSYLSWTFLVFWTLPIWAVAIQGMIQNLAHIAKYFTYYKHLELVVMPLFGLFLNLLQMHYYEESEASSREGVGFGMVALISLKCLFSVIWDGFWTYLIWSTWVRLEANQGTLVNTGVESGPNARYSSIFDMTPSGPNAEN